MPPELATFPFLLSVIRCGDNGCLAKAGFSVVSGLEMQVVPVGYRDGGDNNIVQKLPAMNSFATISLKRGMSVDEGFIDWLCSARQGKVIRADFSIVLFDAQRQEQMHWSFHNGWPCQWAGPESNAKGSELAIESLEICHEGWLRSEPSSPRTR